MSKVPTCLILDFHDSYTRNVLKLVEQLQGWDVEGWEQRVIVVNVDSLSWHSFVESVLPYVDCIVLGPGPGTPHRDADFSWPTRLIAEFGHRVPIFGLCLGLQGLATTFGGTVIEAPAPKHGQISKIRVVEDLPIRRSRLFDDIPSSFDAVQYNSLVVDPASLPPVLEVIAWATSGKIGGQDEIMALQHTSKPLYGVQFHPESIASSHGSTIISNFFRAALDFHREQRDSRRGASPDLPSHVLNLSTAYRPQPSSCPTNVSKRHLFALEQVLIEAQTEWSPRQIFEAFGKGASPLGEIWLESARSSGVPRWSHICVPQSTLSYRRGSRKIRRRLASAPSTETMLDIPSDFTTWLSTLQQEVATATSRRDTSAVTAPVGFIGSIGYELKDETMPLSARAGASISNGSDGSDAELAFAAFVLSYEHETRAWTASGLVRRAEGDPLDSSPIAAASPLRALGMSSGEWEERMKHVSALFRQAPPISSEHTAAPLPTDFQPDQSRDEYISSIQSARQSIVAGDAYELCLTTQFRSTLPADSPLLADPYPLYLTLRAINPAPYCAYFHLPMSDFTILSSSPERFMRIDNKGAANMKPIKGTVRRALDDPVEDERRKTALLADEKERAENLMIVDLIRNDLLASCPVQTVEVPSLMRIESYQTVHQMVTTVVGQLGNDVRPFEAMMRAFPPGSMTGAPKLRSLQLLDRLEGRRDRRAYAGVFGYLAVDGSSDWSVVIRTLVRRGRELRLGAGGAITHQSDPAKEWDEVLTKIHAVLGVEPISRTDKSR